jgi:branched-chain amino acid transport system ATP-binding protein
MLVEEIGKTIKDIERGGFSIILVEQNTRMAFGLSNKTYVLELGNIILEGDPKELANDERVKRIYLGG